MSLDRGVMGFRKTSTNKVLCEYCGNKVKVEFINGKDSCSCCGAGIDEEAVEDNFKELQGMSTAVVDTTIICLQAASEAFELDKKAPSIDKTIDAYKKNRQQTHKSPMTVPQMLAVAFAVMVVLAAVGIINPYSLLGGGPLVDEVTEPIMIDVYLTVAIINATDGAIYDRQGLLEVHEESGEYGGQLLEVFFTMKETITFNLLLEKSKVYEVWCFPYPNATYFSQSFRTMEDYMHRITFII